MKKSKKIMKRLEAWMKGELENDELTAEEIQELERRVFGAIHKKMQSRPLTFDDHETLQ